MRALFLLFLTLLNLNVNAQLSGVPKRGDTTYNITNDITPVNGLEEFAPGNIGQKIVKNVATLEATTADSNGTSLYLVSPAGYYTQVDSAYPESYSGVVYDNATEGKQWVLAEFLRTKNEVEPTDFGAIANDLNSDSAAFANAFAFLKAVNDSGGNVIVPPGEYIATGLKLPHRVNLIAQDGHTYRASSTINSRKNESVVIFGKTGANSYILSADDDGPTWSTYTEQNSIVRGITFNGTNMTSGKLINLNSLIGIKFEDCHFVNGPGTAVKINHCIAIGFEGGSILLNDSTGLQWQGGSGDSYIENMQIGLNRIGISSNGFLMRIIGNKIFNNSVNALSIGGSNIIMLGNDLHDQESGVMISLSGDNHTFSSNSVSKGDTLLEMTALYGSVIANNIFEDAAYGIVETSFISKGNSIGSNTFDVESGIGISNLFSNQNTIMGNIGGDTRNDLYLTTYKTSESELPLTQNTWVKIPLDSVTNRTDSLRLFEDSIRVYQSGLYEITANFTVLSDSATSIEVAPFLEDSIRDAFVSTCYFPDSIAQTIPLLAYEYLSDTTNVSFRLRNTTNDSDVVIKRGLTGLKYIGKREPNYEFGTELVTNGTFDSDITGWTNVDWSTFVWQAGTLHLVYGATGFNSGGISDASRFNVTSGHVYKFRFDVTRNSGSSLLNVDFRFSLAGSVAKAWGQFSTGSYEFNYTATSTTVLNVYFYDNAAGDWTIDNVSMREILNP